MTDVVTFRLEPEKKAALDAIAAGYDRDRSYVLNAAIDAYLAVHDWQVAHIKSAIRQADKGAFASEADVKKAFTKWRK
jgi:predicted transcriptional regulator